MTEVEMTGGPSLDPAEAYWISAVREMGIPAAAVTDENIRYYIQNKYGGEVDRFVSAYYDSPDTFTRPYWEVDNGIAPGQNEPIEPPPQPIEPPPPVANQVDVEVRTQDERDKVVEEPPYDEEERMSSLETCYECLQNCGPIIWMISVCCCLLLTILAIILIACSLERIESTEMGIAYNAPQAILDDEVKEEGLHGKPPFGYFIKWPRTHQTLDQEIRGLSADGVIVTLQVAFQYKVIEKMIPTVTANYRDFEFYAEVMQLKSRSGIRNAAMKFTAQQFQTQRANVQSLMFEDVKNRLVAGEMHALVLDLQITSILRPAKYETAVDLKEQARNNIDRIKNQKTEKLTQANTRYLQTQVNANKTLATASTTAAITMKNAEADGSVIYGQYAAQGALYKFVRNTHSMDTPRLLAYIGTRMIDDMGSMSVGLDAPARLSYMSALVTNSTIRL